MNFLRHIPLFTLILSLSSCVSFRTQVADRVESTLRGGESEQSSYTLKEWSVWDDEILEYQCPHGRSVYFLPLSIKVERQAPALMSYEYGFKAPIRYWESAKGSKRMMPEKQLYVSLSYFIASYSSSSENSAKHIAKLCQKFGLPARAKQDVGIYSGSWERHASAPSDLKLVRRIPVASLKQKLANETLGTGDMGRNYYQSGSWLTQGVVGLSTLVIDYPLFISVSLPAFVYESTLGRLFGGPGKEVDYSKLMTTFEDVYTNKERIRPTP